MVSTAWVGWAPAAVSADKHHRVGAIKHRVGHVGGLGPGGPRVLHHGLEHLGRGDDRLARAVALLDEALLQRRQGLGGHFDAQVTTGDHDAVGHVQDGLEAFDGLRLFNLGDDGDVFAGVRDHFLQARDVRCLLYEGQGDEVDVQLETQLQVVAIFGGDDIHRQNRAGQVQALAVFQQAAVFDHGNDVVGLALFGHQSEDAIIQQDVVADLDVADEVRVGDLDRDGAVVFPSGLGHGQGQFVAFGQFDRVPIRGFDANFGALEILKDAHLATGFFRRPAHFFDLAGVEVMIPVGEVHPGHVHPGQDQIPDGFIRRGRGTKGADYFRASKRRVTIVRNHAVTRGDGFGKGPGGTKAGATIASFYDAKQARRNANCAINTASMVSARRKPCCSPSKA